MKGNDDTALLHTTKIKHIRAKVMISTSLIGGSSGKANKIFLAKIFMLVRFHLSS
jgi:hypothetical protein